MLTDLAVTPISGTLYRLAADRRSGDLQVQSGSVTRMVFFDHGRVVFAGSSLKTERLGETLVALGHITDGDFDRASGMMQADRKLRFGDALVAAGVMDKKAVGTSVANLVAKIVLSLLRLETGSASFEERPCAIPIDFMVSVSIHRLLLKGIGTMSNADLVRAGVGDLDRRVKLARVAPFTFTVDKCTPLQKDVLESATGAITIRRLAATPKGITLGRLRAVYAFLAAGILEEVTQGAAAAPHRPAVETETGGFLLLPTRPEPGVAAPASVIVPPRPVALPAPVEPAPPPPVEAAAPPAAPQRSADVERLLAQANVSLMMSDFAGAVQSYAQIVELEPHVAEHRGRLAVLMTRWPQTLRQAERQFAEAIRLDPDNPELHFQFGRYYRQIKVASRAIAEFRTVVRLDPHHKAARAELAAVSPDDAVFTRLKNLLR